MSITTKEHGTIIFHGVQCDTCGRYHHHMHAADWHVIHREATGAWDGWVSYGGDTIDTVRHKCRDCRRAGKWDDSV